MIDIIKAKKADAENELKIYKSAMLKVEAKLEVYNEILAEAEKKEESAKLTDNFRDCTEETVSENNSTL
jgi:hypothetical protein